MAIPAAEQDRVNEHIDGLTTRLAGLPPKTQQEELLRIRLRIENNLAHLADGHIRPAMVVPAAQKSASEWVLRAKDAEWLGVCAGIGARLGIEPFFIRLGAVTLGLLTGPFALLAYLVAYAALRVETPEGLTPRANGWRITKGLVSTLASAVAVFAVAQFLCVVILHLYGLFLGNAYTPIPHPWDWWTVLNEKLLFWTIVWATPLAVLGGMPLPEKWDKTLGKTAQAVVALFGIATAFGLACLFVGAVMQIMPHMAGIVMDRDAWNRW